MNGHICTMLSPMHKRKIKTIVLILLSISLINLNLLPQAQSQGIQISSSNLVHSDKTNNPTQTDISKGSSGSTTHYIQSIQEREDIFVETYLLGKDEFLIDENITVQFRIRNEFNKRIYIENIHIPIPNEFYSKICTPPNKTAKCDKIADGFSVIPIGTLILDDERAKEFSIPAYDSFSFNYTIRTNITRPYILPEATITYWKDNIKKKLYSTPLYLKVIDSPPEIISIRLSPAPFEENKNICFNINFEDHDARDLMGIEVWSNIDGRIYKNNTIPNIYNNSYNITFDRPLSVGIHLLTFKINDSNNMHIEKEMTIEVKKTIFWQYVWLHGLATFIMIFGFFNFIKIMCDWGVCSKIKSFFGGNLLAVALMIVFFIICIAVLVNYLN